MNIQDEVSKIHGQFGVSELANYKIQLLFDKHGIEQYNQALDDAVKSVNLKEARDVEEYNEMPSVSNDMGDVYVIDKQSILKLKMSTLSAP